MRLKCIHLTTLSLLSALFLGVNTNHAQGNTSRSARNMKQETVDFPISCSSEAQKQFSHGVALLHHMQYAEAEKSFLEVAGTDPDCAMAYWGIAMAYMRPLWLDPGTRGEHVRKGRQAIDRARVLKAKSDRERAYVAAVAAFYDEENVDAQLRGWERGMKKIHQAYPDDAEATAFYALAHLATAPAKLSHRERAGEILEALSAQNPEHPGAIHYLIHAYDDPALAHRGVGPARAYDKVAPEVPHALHMPSHIFVRLGMWQDCILWNQRSAQAALKLPRVDGLISNHYPHAMDYLIYAYLQRAQDKEAKEAIDQFWRNGGYEKEIGAAYAVAAIPARYALERHRWEEAAELAVSERQLSLWEEYPEIEAISWHARGLGAARKGDLSAARRAIQTLDSLYRRVAERPTTECDWAVTIDAQRKAVAAWVALGEGRKVAAQDLMRDAVSLENSETGCAATGWIMTIPAQELLGDMLFEMDRPADALQAYEASLRIVPNRFNSLYGAGRASEQLGDGEKAKAYYRKLVEMTDDGASERASLRMAKEFLSRN